MKSPIPFVTNGQLHTATGDVVLSLPGPAERTGWQDWLENPAHTSFRYESTTGVSFVVRKEKNTGRSGKVFFYWKATKHVLGVNRRVYVGKSENVTVSTLEETAGKLVQLRAGERDKRRLVV